MVQGTRKYTVITGASSGIGYETAKAFAERGKNLVITADWKRISNKLGLTKNSEPEKIEQDLMKELPKDHWILYNIQIITFGRSICTARNPKCEECFLAGYCNFVKPKQKKMQ